MTKFFAIPDKEKEYQSYMIYVLSIIWSVVTGIIVFLGLYFFPNLWHRWITLLGVSFCIAAFNLTLNYLGYVRLASWSLTIMLWLYITIPCYSAGGILAPGILSQTSIILTAGFLLGWRAGIAIGLLTIGTDFWMAYMQSIGHMPPPTVVHNPMSRWVGTIIPFTILIVLQYYATNHLRTSLAALQREIMKREKAEKIKDKTLYDLTERVKEQKTLYTVSRILQNEDTPQEQLFNEIVEIIPLGWQYPDITSACISIGETKFFSLNYQPSEHFLQTEMETVKGTKVSIKVAYSKAMPELDEGPFLKEERNLITILAEMLTMDLERKERGTKLKNYKYALDIGYMVSISDIDGSFIFVNENFCIASKYTQEELLGKNHNILWSNTLSEGYFTELTIAMQDGTPYRGEFCNRAKDGTLYWVDTTIIPFLDENGIIYQYLSINHNITERKIAEEKIKQSEQTLKKITSQVPGNTYMFEIDENGNPNILFMNHGTEAFYNSFDRDDVTKEPVKIREVLHNDDKVKFSDSMKEAYKTLSDISFQYRIIVNDQIRWQWIQAVAEKEENGKIVWYGATRDITSLVDYIASMEQIVFDIGHVIRRPISSMLGMTSLIADGNLSKKEIIEVSQKLHSISDEMDKFIHELNIVYSQKKQETKHNIDISPLIDRRGSLFQ